MKRDSDPTTHSDDFAQHEQTYERQNAPRGERDNYAESENRGQPVDGDQEPNHSELSTDSRRGAPSSKNKRKRRLIAGVAFMLITLGVLLFAYYTFSPSHSVKVNISTKQSGHAQDATAKPDKGPDEVTADAIAQVRSAISNNSPASTAPTSVIPRGTQNASNPMPSSVLPPDSTPVDTATTGNPGPPKRHDESASEVSRRNQERSIRFSNERDQHQPAKDDLGSRLSDAVYRNDDSQSRTYPAPGTLASTSREAGSISTASHKLLLKPSLSAPVLPSFGSILPVRTLGKIYTLRSGSAIRLELTRYVAGDGWALAKGTILIGQVRGSEQDRAFIAITGFIDPGRDRLVNLNGEVLGDDGGSGIRGKFHKLSSGWSRAFSRVGSAAVNVAGAVAGSRISGQPVIVGDIGSRTISPFSYELDSNLLQQSRGFVEVPAATSAFVLVTTLPADVKGADAEPEHLAQSPNVIATSANQPGGLSQDELAVLLTSGDPKAIREALPRMSPQMRRVAETLLAETAQDSDKE